MIKEKIRIKKRTMPIIALLLIVVALGVGFNTNKLQVHAYANESTDYETQYYELSPILEKNFYETGEQINVSFVLDSQYVLSNITYETNGFTLANPPIVNENSISVVLDYLSADNAEFEISVETTSGKIFASSIYGFFKDTGFVISQYPAQNIGDFTNINDANNQNNFNTLGLFDTVTISGKLSWTDESGNVHILRRTKYEYGGASVSDDGSTYIPLTVYYKYTDDFGNYSVSLNTLGYDVYVTAYATGRSAGSTDASVTVYQDGGVVRQYENFVYLSNPSSQTLIRNHTVTPSGTYDEDKEITRSFEICQAIIKGAEYVKEMRNGIDTPHVNVNYPSGLATSVGGGRAAYFSIPSPRIYIPVGRINWDTLYHEYGHHIGMKLGIDDHPAQNLEIHMGWPPLVFDLDYDYSMFNSITYSSYSKSQHIRITWAEAYAYYLSMMIRHYYLEDFNGIPASSYVRYFSISGGVDEGEASVPAIQSVLWRTYKDVLNAGRNINDIATGSSSTKIAIKNTHKVMWNILSNSQTNSTIKSYSAYSDYFTNNYPEHRSEFGRISAIYGMSPINVTFSTYSESVSPTISWHNSFVSTNYEVNNYSLVFYDNSNEEILRINDINTTSYKLSDANWTQVKNNFGNGDHVNIHVLAFQTNTPTTGGFISQAFKLSHLIYTPINNGGAYSITGILNKQFNGSIEILDEYQVNPVTQIGILELCKFNKHYFTK